MEIVGVRDLVTHSLSMIQRVLQDFIRKCYLIVFKNVATHSWDIDFQYIYILKGIKFKVDKFVQ